MVSLPTGIEGQQPCCEGYSLALVTRQPSREVGGGGGMAASLLGTLGLSHRPWLLDSRAWAQGSPGARPASSRSGNGSGSGKTSAEDTPSSPWQESGAVPGLSRSAPGATLGAGRGGAGADRWLRCPRSRRRVRSRPRGSSGARRRGRPAAMAAHGKLRRERGLQTEYETQVKGERALGASGPVSCRDPECRGGARKALLLAEPSAPPPSLPPPTAPGLRRGLG